MAKLNLIPKNSGIALIFPVDVKRNQSYELHETTITEKNSNPIGFILLYRNGKLEYEPIKQMTSTTNNSIIEFNDTSSILYNVLHPSNSFIKKIYFKKTYSPLNFWTKTRDEVEQHEPKIFGYHLNGESETIMKGGNDINNKIIKLKSAVYGEINKKFFYEFIVEVGDYNENDVEIKSIKFNKIHGEHVEEYGIQDGITHEGGAWWKPWTWGRSSSVQVTPGSTNPPIVANPMYEPGPAAPSQGPQPPTPPPSRNPSRGPLPQPPGFVPPVPAPPPLYRIPPPRNQRQPLSSSGSLSSGPLSSSSPSSDVYASPRAHAEVDVYSSLQDINIINKEIYINLQKVYLHILNILNPLNDEHLNRIRERLHAPETGQMVFDLRGSPRQVKTEIQHRMMLHLLTILLMIHSLIITKFHVKANMFLSELVTQVNYPHITISELVPRFDIKSTQIINYFKLNPTIKYQIPGMKQVSGNNLHLLLLKTILYNMMKLVHNNDVEVNNWIQNPQEPIYSAGPVSFYSIVSPVSQESVYANPRQGGSRNVQYYRLKIFANESEV
jgi:hypothetical protein